MKQGQEGEHQLLQMLLLSALSNQCCQSLDEEFKPVAIPLSMKVSFTFDPGGKGVAIIFDAFDEIEVVVVAGRPPKIIR